LQDLKRGLLTGNFKATSQVSSLVQALKCQTSEPYTTSLTLTVFQIT